MEGAGGLDSEAGDVKILRSSGPSRPVIEDGLEVAPKSAAKATHGAPRVDQAEEGLSGTQIGGPTHQRSLHSMEGVNPGVSGSLKEICEDPVKIEEAVLGFFTLSWEIWTHFLRGLGSRSLCL